MMGKFDCNVSPYKALYGSFAKYYSIFNDGIQKFAKESNDVMQHTMGNDLNTNIVWALTIIQGGSMDSWNCDNKPNF